MSSIRSDDKGRVISRRTFLGLAALTAAAPGLIAKRAAVSSDHASPGADWDQVVHDLSATRFAAVRPKGFTVLWRRPSPEA